MLKKPIVIENFHKGIADYDYNGFVRMIGCNPYEPLGALSTIMNRQFDIGGYSDSMYVNPQWDTTTNYGASIKVLSDIQVSDTVVYANRILSTGTSGYYNTDTSSAGSIIDAIIYKDYFLYITTSGLYAQKKGTGASGYYSPALIASFTFSSLARMFSTGIGTVFILDGSKIHLFQGYSNNLAFDSLNPQTYTCTLNALDASINLETFISFASNNLYAIFGTSKGNVYSYNIASGSLAFDSMVHLSDLPIPIMFESANKLYSITANFALYQITPSTITEYTQLRNGVSNSRKVGINVATNMIAGFITDKFYVFWYNSSGFDNPDSNGFYDSGILPSGVYAFTNPSLFNGQEVGLFCLSAINPAGVSGTAGLSLSYLISNVKSFCKSKNGWLAMTVTNSMYTALNGTINSNRYAIMTNQNYDFNNSQYTIPRYKPQFDTQIIQIGTSQNKSKVAKCSISFYGSGNKFRVFYRDDNNGAQWRLMTTTLQGADADGWLDCTNKAFADFTVSAEEHTNCQFRFEFHRQQNYIGAGDVSLNDLQII